MGLVPSSSTSTVELVSVRRFARTRPAVPPPTMIKSYEAATDVELMARLVNRTEERSPCSGRAEIVAVSRTSGRMTGNVEVASILADMSSNVTSSITPSVNRMNAESKAH